MSTLTVTNISSPNATADLVVKTGNTSGPQIVVSANGAGVYFKGNSAANSVFINSTDVYINGVIPTSSIANLTITGGNNVISGNVTPTAFTANTSAWNPGTSNVFVIRMQANASSNNEHWVSGLTAGTNGQIIILSNIGSGKITLRNEDSANETTAGNRFNLGNHVPVQGFGSIKLIYDGTLARWRPMNSALVAFDHKYSLTKGFFAGGSSISVAVDKTTYSTETTVAAGSGTNLSQAREFIGGAGNADKGFFGGGYYVSPAVTSVATVERTAYSSEATAAVSGASLSQTRYYPGAAGNADKGFFAGGTTYVAPAGTLVATADRTTYSSETTAAVAGANLSQARGYVSAAGNVDKGFFAGGSYTTTTDRTTYSTEVTAVVSGASLNLGVVGVGSAGNSDKGFFSGGQGPGPAFAWTAIANRTTYSSETTAAVAGANLSQARGYTGGAGNDVKGFFVGGSTGGVLATADRTTYSSETTAAVSGANLSQAKYGMGSI